MPKYLNWSVWGRGTPSKIKIYYGKDARLAVVEMHNLVVFTFNPFRSVAVCQTNLHLCEGVGHQGQIINIQHEGHIVHSVPHHSTCTFQTQLPMIHQQREKSKGKDPCLIPSPGCTCTFQTHLPYIIAKDSLMYSEKCKQGWGPLLNSIAGVHLHPLLATYQNISLLLMHLSCHA